MSKVDAQRAMREARYARNNASGPTRREEAAAQAGGPAPAAPPKAAAAAKAAKAAPVTKATPAADTAPTEALHDAAFGVPEGRRESLERELLRGLRSDGSVIDGLTFVAELDGEVLGVR